MTTDLSVEEQVEMLERAISKLWDAADLLQPLLDVPEIRDCIAELEGNEYGWFRTDEGAVPALVDSLIDEVIKLRGPSQGLKRY